MGSAGTKTCEGLNRIEGWQVLSKKGSTVKNVVLSVGLDVSFSFRGKEVEQTKLFRVNLLTT